MLHSGCTGASAMQCSSIRTTESGIVNYKVGIQSLLLRHSVTSLGIRSSSFRYPLLSFHAPQAGSHFQPQLSAASPYPLARKCGGLFSLVEALPRKQIRKQRISPRASGQDVPFSFRYPAMTKKPRWWWRTLACLPYLLPLHEPWAYAKTAFNLHPFIEWYKYHTYPFYKSLALPRHFFLAYFIISYLFIVRRKELPHFFRFHVIMGMLMQITLGIIGQVFFKWMPKGLYWGKIGMHFWTFMFFSEFFTIVECIRCCLTGYYADIPFISDAAYIQMPYD